MTSAQPPEPETVRPAVPPAVPPPIPPPAAPPPARKRTFPWAALATSLLAALLLDLAVETFLSGSPARWTVGGTAILAVGMLVLLWQYIGPTARLAIPLTTLVALVAWTVLRLGSWADPALALATLTLPRLVLGLGLAGIAAALALLLRLRFVRRNWYLAGTVAVLAAYSAVPIAWGLLAGASPLDVVRGAFDWQRLPAWLDGAYVGTEVLLPLGVAAGVACAVLAILKRARPILPTAGLIVVLAAFFVLSVELTRVGRPNIADATTGPLLDGLSTTTVPGGQAPAGEPGSTRREDAGSAGNAGKPAAAARSAVQQQTARGVTPLPASPVTVARPGEAAASKAIELSVTGHRAAASIGGRDAGPGREFVVVDTAWKNLLPPREVNRKKAADRTAGAGSLGFGGGATASGRERDEADTTVEPVRFEAGALPNHLWLVVDGRVAEPIDVEATRAIEGHVGPEAVAIPGFQQVVQGGVVFAAPAGARDLSLLFLDSINGHLLVPVAGDPPTLATGVGGAARANEFVDLALTGALLDGGREAGTSRLLVGLRGISRREALVDVPFGKYGFLQTDAGCVAMPDADTTGLARPLSPLGRFIPFVPGEGQLAFTVPADTKAAALLLRLPQGGGIDLPVIGDARPSWPAPASTITDGDVLRVLVLPGLEVPEGVGPAQAGGERVGLDLVVENLRPGSGIELQAAQQFRLVGPGGQRVAPSADSRRAPCRLDAAAVVPAGGSRRFTLVYDVPPGAPLQLEYRGFNVQSELVKVR